MPRNVVQDVVVGAKKPRKRKAAPAPHAPEPVVEPPHAHPPAPEPARMEEVVRPAPPPPPPPPRAEMIANEAPRPRNETLDLDEHPFFHKKQPYHAGANVDDRFLERRFAARPPRKTHSKILIVTAVAALAGLGVGAIFLFKGVTVTVTPKSATAALDTTIIAQKSAAPGQLGYDLMMLEGTDASTVAATSQSQVDKKASGTITIVNNYSSASQKLIANTRFQTPDGLVFRIASPVTVPGTKNGAPGTVDVTVTADKSGDAYNIASSTFTIPGFQGDPRYAKITAVAKTAMTGGFSGMLAQPTKADLDTAVAALQKATNDKLLASAASQKPDGFQLYDNAVFVRFDDPQVVPDPSQPGMATVQLHGTLYGMLLDKKKLSQYVAAQLLGTLTPNSDVLIDNLDSLSFSIANKDSIDPKTATSITFALKGSPEIVWQYDEQALRAALLGKSRSDFDGILAQFSTITRARADFRPLGIPQTFPTDPKKITIVTAAQ